MTLAQQGDKLRTQLASGVGVDGGVDRLVGHVAFGLMRKHAPQRSGDLRGRTGGAGPDPRSGQGCRRIRGMRLDAGGLRTGNRRVFGRWPWPRPAPARPRPGPYPFV